MKYETSKAIQLYSQVVFCISRTSIYSENKVPQWIYRMDKAAFSPEPIRVEPISAEAEGNLLEETFESGL